MKQVFEHFPEMKNDMIAIYNEVQEAKDNIEEADLYEAVKNEFLREAVDRLEKAIYWLEKYVSKEDLIKENLND